MLKLTTILILWIAGYIKVDNLHFVKAEDEESNSQSTKDHSLVYFKGFHVDSVTPESNASLHKHKKWPKLRLIGGLEQGHAKPGPSFLPSKPNKEERTRPSYQTIETSETKQKPSYAMEVYGLPVTVSNSAETQENIANETPFLIGVKQDETNLRPIHGGSRLSGTKEKTQYLTGFAQTETKGRPSYADYGQSETKTSSNFNGLDGNSMNVRPGDWRTKPDYERQKENDAQLENFARLQANDESLGSVKEPFAIKYAPPQMAEPKPKPTYSFNELGNTNGLLSNPFKPYFSDASAGFGPPPVAIVTPKRGIDTTERVWYYNKGNYQPQGP